MAEYSFYVKNIQADIKKQSVELDFSMDVDMYTMGMGNVYLINRKTNAIVPFDIDMDECKVTLKLKEWAVPNSNYMLILESGIKSITGSPLPTSMTRNVIFKSEVISTIEILSPKNFEHMSQELKLKFQEKGKIVTNKYYLEVAADNAFYNMSYKTNLDCNGEDNTTTANLMSLPDGQYYFRIRAEKDGEYGLWSEVRTVVFEKGAITPEKPAAQGEESKDTAAKEKPKVIDLTGDAPAAVSPEEIVKENTSSGTSTTGDTSTTKTETKTEDTRPMYCTLTSLKMLVDTFGIPDENMTEYIKNASAEADFLRSSLTSTSKKNTYAVEQYVRTRATIDCLTRLIMQKTANGGGAKYTLDTATYEDSMNSGSFKNLLGDLYKELQKWQDAMRGYFNEGRAKPKATRIGIKSSQNSDVSHTSIDTILNDISRTMPQWS